MFSIYIKAEMSVADVCLFFVFLDNLSSWTNINFLRSVFHDHCFQQQRINVLFIVLHYQQWYIWSPLTSSSVFFLHLKQLSDVSKKCTARDLRKEWKKCNSQEPRHENRARVRVTLRRNMKNSMSQLKQKREVSNLFHSLHTLIFRNVTDNKFTSKLSKRAFGCSYTRMTLTGRKKSHFEVIMTKMYEHYLLCDRVQIQNVFYQCERNKETRKKVANHFTFLSLYFIANSSRLLSSSSDKVTSTLSSEQVYSCISQTAKLLGCWMDTK